MVWSQKDSVKGVLGDNSYEGHFVDPAFGGRRKNGLTDTPGEFELFGVKA